MAKQIKMQPNDTYNWHRSLGWGQKGFGSRLIGEIRKIRENRDNARADLLEGGTGRILCDLLRLCFRFLFCFILERPFQAIDFASRHFLLFFPEEENAEKCVNEIGVAAPLSLHCQQFCLKPRQLMIICGWQMEKETN